MPTQSLVRVELFPALLANMFSVGSPSRNFRKRVATVGRQMQSMGGENIPRVRATHVVHYTITACTPMHMQKGIMNPYTLQWPHECQNGAANLHAPTCGRTQRGVSPFCGTAGVPEHRCSRHVALKQR